MTQFKIEENGYYRTRAGKKVNVLIINGRAMVTSNDGGMYTCSLNGMHMIEESPTDIVAMWNQPQESIHIQDVVHSFITREKRRRSVNDTIDDIIRVITALSQLLDAQNQGILAEHLTEIREKEGE